MYNNVLSISHGEVIVIKTTDGRELAVTTLTNAELLQTLLHLNPTLANALRFSAIDDNYRFYKARYRFGNPIIQNKTLYLPLADGEVIASTDNSLPQQLLNDLAIENEQQNPLALVLNKTCEVFTDHGGYPQTHNLIKPGNFFGIPRVLDKTPDASTSSSILDFQINAGGRSIFMLPKIGDQICHCNLKERFAVGNFAPSSYNEHYPLFVTISKDPACDWICEVIFFPRELINQIREPSFASVQIALSDILRSNYSVAHNDGNHWEKAFYNIELKKQLHKMYSTQSLLIAQNIYKIAAKIIPGTRPATTDDSAPIDFIAKVYRDIYYRNAKTKYAPIILEKAFFDGSTPIYESLNSLSYNDDHLKASNKKSHITFLEEIRLTIDIYNKEFTASNNIVKSLQNIATNSQFSFYHTNADNYPKISSIADLSGQDPRFIATDDCELPSNAGFFKGVIKIS